MKVSVPGLDPTGGERRTLLAADGRGYVRLLRHDAGRQAMLLERLGPQLAELGLSVDDQLRAICSTLSRAWAPLPRDEVFTTGAEKATSLAALIFRAWHEFGHPCAAETVHVACSYAEDRARAHDPSTAVLSHGDAHVWNTLVDPDGPPGSFKFVDPDGLFAEPAYDLGISMREWSGPKDPVTDGHRRCRMLAALTGVDAEPIWQWGLVERTANGLLWLQSGMADLAKEFLVVADAWASAGPP